jgi:hypothetical protein
MTDNADADAGENGGDDEGTVKPQPHHGRPDDDREALGAVLRARAAGRDRSGLEGRDRGACLGHR